MKFSTLMYEVIASTKIIPFASLNSEQREADYYT